MIGALYEYHIAVRKIKRPMSDTERREWEAMVWKYFDKCMFSCSRCHLPEYPKFPKDKSRLDKMVTGRLYEQLFDIINYRMRLSRAIAEIYDKKLPQAVKTPEGAENRTNYYYNLSISHTRKKVKV